MKSICIVDDSSIDANRIKNFAEQFANEKNIELLVRIFKDGLDFLSHYKADADVIFLDVEMPILNGLEVAQKIREMDNCVAIVFVTKMVKYALKGYSVGALDYIVKPATYFSVADCLRRAVQSMSVKQTKKILINTSASETVSVLASSILYVEKNSNYLIFHTEQGVYKTRSSIKDIENELSGLNFSKSINGCLVNLHFVEKTTLNSVYVGKEILPLARHRRKDFMNDLINYFGRGV